MRTRSGRSILLEVLTAPLLSNTPDDDAIAIARGTWRDTGTECIAVAFEPEVHGGSISSSTGDQIVRALAEASEDRLPFIAFSGSGGVRVQEGVHALVQVQRISAAAGSHRRRGLPQVGIIVGACTGGATAALFAGMDVVFATSGSVYAFAGPRVATALTGVVRPPCDATFAMAHGLVDEIVEVDQIHDRMASLLNWRDLGRPSTWRWDEPALVPLPSVDGWQAVQRARAPFRRQAMAYVRALHPILELRGDRRGGDDPGVRTFLAQLHEEPVIAVATDRRSGRSVLTAAGLRKARRSIELADRWGLPLISFVDTPGAGVTAEDEGSGIGQEIHSTLTAMLDCRSPIVAVVTGEGGSGGALALCTADRLLMLQDAVFEVIAPEAAAAITDRDASLAPSAARAMKPTAKELWEQHLIDRVLPPSNSPIGPVIQHVSQALASIRTSPTTSRRSLLLTEPAPSSAYLSG